MLRGLFAASLASIVLAAQSQPPPAPTFRAGVNYVRADVSVVDDHGDPIVDLDKSDFEVLEDGRQQTITAFELVQIPYEPHVDAAPLDSDVVSNATDADRRLWAIVLDDLHTRKERIAALRATARELVNRLGPFDLAAIVPTSAHFSALQEFTHNRIELNEAIDRINSRYDPRLRRMIARAGPSLGANPVTDSIPDLQTMFKRCAFDIDDRRCREPHGDSRSAVEEHPLHRRGIRIAARNALRARRLETCGRPARAAAGRRCERAHHIVPGTDVGQQAGRSRVQCVADGRIDRSGRPR
jgi:VWFA-related protein